MATLGNSNSLGSLLGALMGGQGAAPSVGQVLAMPQGQQGPAVPAGGGGTTTNPNTGVVQAPAGMNPLKKLLFGIQNDPAIRKGLQVAGLNMMKGGNNSFTRNLAESGLVGLQTLEGQRGIQRQNVQAKAKTAAQARQTAVGERRNVLEERRIKQQGERDVEARKMRAKEFAHQVAQDAEANADRDAARGLQQKQLDRSTEGERVVADNATDMIANQEFEFVYKDDGSVDEQATERRARRLAREIMRAGTEQDAINAAVKSAREDGLPGEPVDIDAAVELGKRIYQSQQESRTGVPRGTQEARDRRAAEAAAKAPAEAAAETPATQQPSISLQEARAAGLPNNTWQDKQTGVLWRIVGVNGDKITMQGPSGTPIEGNLAPVAAAMMTDVPPETTVANPNAQLQGVAQGLGDLFRNPNRQQ